MEIFPLKVGEMGTNCYLLIDQETSKTLIIDPGDESDFISTTILEKKLAPQAILLTHGHSDHLGAATELKLIFNIPVYLHPKDLFLAKKRLKFTPQSLQDGQTFELSSSSLQVLHTPGHTPGSCCFLSTCHSGLDPESSPKSLFTGDTLFTTGPGAADRAYSSPSDLKNSLSKLKSAISHSSSHLRLFPGHEDFDIPLL